MQDKILVYCLVSVHRPDQNNIEYKMSSLLGITSVISYMFQYIHNPNVKYNVVIIYITLDNSLTPKKHLQP